MTDTSMILFAWERWDTACLDKHYSGLTRSTKRLEDEIELAAMPPGITSSNLRDMVTANRRKGLSLADAIDAALFI